MSYYKLTQNYALLATLLLVFAAQLVAAAPRPVNYQGFLTQSDGTPIDSSVALMVSLWDDAVAGNLLYSESHASVSVSKGRFSIQIGSGSPISGTYDADHFQQETWLELTVNSEVLSPRSQLGAVASAQHAVNAEQLMAACADGEVLSFQGGVSACAPGCFAGDRMGCYDGGAATREVGECASGIRECSNGVFGSCSGQVLPVTESCNLLDDDCDGEVDEGDGIPGCTNAYLDADGDGVGLNGTQVCFCGNQSGTSTVGGDCDDNDQNTYPGQPMFFTAPNVMGNFDYDCSGSIETNWGNTVASCTYNGSTCDHVQGFVGSVPACGTGGNLSAGCAQNGTVCTVQSGFPGVSVACH